MSTVKRIIRKVIGEKKISVLREMYSRICDREFAKELDKNVRFRNIHLGQRCFIFGNGPSLKSLDFSLFKNEQVFTVNQLARNPEFPKLQTNYHMWSDERFFDINPDDPSDRELLESMRNVKTFYNEPVVFYKYAAREMIKKTKLDDDLNIAYYEQGCYQINPNKEVDFNHVTPAFSSVVHYLVCLAVYMGFSKIYLLGCDCTSIITIVNSYLKQGEQAQYAYGISDAEKKRMERIQAKTSVVDEFKSQIRLFEDYVLLFEYCKNHGCELFNATKPSLLDTIPYVEIQSVLGDTHG